jgi:hypothetical protein
MWLIKNIVLSYLCFKQDIKEEFLFVIYNCELLLKITWFLGSILAGMFSHCLRSILIFYLEKQEQVRTSRLDFYLCISAQAFSDYKTEIHSLPAKQAFYVHLFLVDFLIIYNWILFRGYFNVFQANNKYKDNCFGSGKVYC